MYSEGMGSEMYEKEGITFPRCTDIISDSTNKSQGLIQWSANQAVEYIRANCDEPSCPFYMVDESDLEQARFAYKDTSKIALDVGSDVHNAIEKHLKKESYTLVSTQAEQAFKAFIEWEDSVELKPLLLEQTVWGDRWGGTLDMVCMLNGKKYVVDFKTSKAFYMTEMGAQIAAYRSCIADAKGSGILRLDKETGLPFWKDFSKRYSRDLKVFEAMVTLYFLRHPRVAKRFEKGE